MNTIENLWREYLRIEFSDAPPPEEPVAARCHAFFTGDWCQLVFNRKIRDLNPANARTVNDAIELELAKVVSSPPSNSNLEPTTASRLAA